MNNVLGCLQHKDSVGYYNLFLPFDTLWQMVLHNPDHSPEVVKELDQLKEHPQSLIEFDPHYNSKIMGGFYKVLEKGEDSGLHWKNIVIQRYELKKEIITNRNLVGYDKIAPERFKGYLFVRDLMGRLTFCITITEIQKINGYFFGGQVTNILEASTTEQYLLKEQKEQKYFEWLAKHPQSDSLVNDSLKIDSIKKGLIDTFGGRKTNVLNVNPDDDDKSQVRKEVVDRKYYEGKFDNEIPVKLYIRYMKDPKTGKVVSYDGLYKFGDQKSYAKLSITKTDDGKWLMEDDPPVGTMELELKDKIYTGSWLNNENGTGYDVLLKPADIPEPKLEQLDNILERGLSGSVNEETFEKKESEKAKEEEKKEPKTEEEKKQERKEKRRLKRIENRREADRVNDPH
ncbi:MAG: hypothetical protein ACHQD8_06360 [Chitinophagales bacterium]